uniref:Uncharacterized protein n=1 Tax=Aegilops tauschii subsp. strangulata TaxID=200361 RepID=A0A453M7N1_AEGTS
AGHDADDQGGAPEGAQEAPPRHGGREEGGLGAAAAAGVRRGAHALGALPRRAPAPLGQVRLGDPRPDPGPPPLARHLRHRRGGRRRLRRRQDPHQREPPPARRRHHSAQVKDKGWNWCSAGDVKEEEGGGCDGEAKVGDVSIAGEVKVEAVGCAGEVKVEAVGCADGSKEAGGSSEVQAVKPMWAMITGKRKKRSGCGTRVGALHASSVCVEEVGGT